MNKNYSQLLENLLTRRYDEALRESIVSDTFERSNYPDSLKYVLESMEEIDPSYTYKTFHITKRIQDKIETAFKARGIKADFRYQGAIQTETHVVLHGGVELLIISKSHGKKPWEIVRDKAQEVMECLSGDPMFKSVDYSSKLDIKITTTKPRCEIRVVPVVWLENKDYLETKREIDRGVCEYNLERKTKRKYLPFLNIARLNSKDSRCNGGLKRMIRLLSSILRDSEEDIKLTDYQISSVLFDIPDKQLKYNSEYSLSLIGVVSAQLNRIVTDNQYRMTLVSPSEKELVFGKNPRWKTELEKLQKELDLITTDLQEELQKDGKTLYSELKYEN